MSKENFRQSLLWIKDEVFPKLGITPEHTLTFEYLGGEVLLIPQEELHDHVTWIEENFSSSSRRIIQGAQSNLIGSPKRILGLADTFKKRVGTSWDPISGQRHIKGNKELYDAILNRSLQTLKSQKGMNPGRVLVVDKLTSPHLSDIIENAFQEGHDVVMRPVFQGGSKDILPDSIDNLVYAYESAFDSWAKERFKFDDKTTPHIQPFESLYQSRRASLSQPSLFDRRPEGTGCPFQANCAATSLCLDPDGDIYICQEMADAGHYPLGNAFTKTFNDDVWMLLARRSQKLDSTCLSCPWVRACGGGCMNEAIERFGDPFAKTELCRVWTSLFIKMDSLIKKQLSMKDKNLDTVS